MAVLILGDTTVVIVLVESGTNLFKESLGERQGDDDRTAEIADWMTIHLQLGRG